MSVLNPTTGGVKVQRLDFDADEPVAFLNRHHARAARSHVRVANEAIGLKLQERQRPSHESFGLLCRMLALDTCSNLMTRRRADANPIPKKPVNTERSVWIDAAPRQLAVALIADFTCRDLVPGQPSTTRQPIAKFMRSPQQMLISMREDEGRIERFVVSVDALWPLAREASGMEATSSVSVRLPFASLIVNDSLAASASTNNVSVDLLPVWRITEDRVWSVERGQYLPAIAKVQRRAPDMFDATAHPRTCEATTPAPSGRGMAGAGVSCALKA